MNYLYRIIHLPQRGFIEVCIKSYIVTCTKFICTITYVVVMNHYSVFDIYRRRKLFKLGDIEVIRTNLHGVTMKLKGFNPLIKPVTFYKNIIITIRICTYVDTP